MSVTAPAAEKTPRAHGRRARYVHGESGTGNGCRCDDCRAANTRYASHRDRMQVYGQWEPFTSAAGVRAHIERLHAAGLGDRQISRQSGVARSTLKLVRDGSREHLTRRTAEAILAVTPGRAQLAPGARVDATGATRRLQAMVAGGWPLMRLADQLGTSQGNFCELIRATRITAATDQAIRDLFTRQWDKPPPQRTREERTAALRARRHAERLGWLPALAWDVDQIDDPASKPVHSWQRSERVRHSGAALTEDAAWIMHHEGCDARRAAERLGVKTDTLQQAMRRAQEREAAGQTLADVRRLPVIRVDDSWGSGAQPQLPADLEAG